MKKKDEKIVWCFSEEDIAKRGFNLALACSEIAQAFLAEAHLLVAEPEELQRSFKSGLSIIGFKFNGRVVAHARLSFLVDDWFELGGTFISSEHRGQGINHKMYRVFLARHKDRNILATTTNEVSLQVGADLGFVQLSRHRFPELIWRTSCICPAEKRGIDEAGVCKLADTKCFFRVTKETWHRLKDTSLSVNSFLNFKNKLKLFYD